jgi:hypothetical protein
VIERELGEKLPKSLTLEVIEESENKVYILLPSISETENLSDAELSKLAAGRGIVTSGRISEL